MTVQKLREALRKMPSDASVMVYTAGFEDDGKTLQRSVTSATDDTKDLGVVTLWVEKHDNK